MNAQNSKQTTEEETIEKIVPEDPPTKMRSGVIEEGKPKLPDSIKDKDIFICYRKEKQSDGSVDKVPYKPTLSGFYQTDPTSADDAVSCQKAIDIVRNSKQRGGKSFDGVGLVVEKEGPIAGFDLDDCVDLETGSVAEYALEIIFALPGGFVELSQSGTGLHIYFFCENGLDDSCLNKVPIGENGEMELELYDVHYFCITGRTIQGFSQEITECGKEAREIQRAWMQSGSGSDGSDSGSSGGRPKNTATEELKWDPGTAPESNQMTDEDWELIEAACEADDELEALWNDEVDYSNRSVAEFRLACKLAWWTAEDYGTYHESCPDAMERMMRASELERKKFDKSSGDYSYIRLTIGKAIQEDGIVPEDR